MNKQFADELFRRRFNLYDDEILIKGKDEGSEGLPVTDSESERVRQVRCDLLFSLASSFFPLFLLHHVHPAPFSPLTPLLLALLSPLPPLLL